MTFTYLIFILFFLHLIVSIRISKKEDTNKILQIVCVCIHHHRKIALIAMKQSFVFWKHVSLFSSLFEFGISLLNVFLFILSYVFQYALKYVSPKTSGTMQLNTQNWIKLNYILHANLFESLIGMQLLCIHLIEVDSKWVFHQNFRIELINAQIIYFTIKSTNNLME